MMANKVKSFFSDSLSVSEQQQLNNMFCNGVDEGAKQIYRGARNTLYDFTLASGRRVCIKHFRKAKFPNSYIYTNLRHSKAHRSFTHAQRLLQLGFLTPAPLAYSETKRGLKLKESYYVCEFLDLPNIRQWYSCDDTEAITAALAQEMLRLHRSGVLHRDFSPGNILYDHREDGDYKFYYVDLNRMNFNVANRKRLMRMFRSISLEAEPTERLARAYAEAASLRPDIVAAAAIGSLNSYLRSKARHRRLKRMLHLSKK
jgi:serine/threonine protein kinase